MKAVMFERYGAPEVLHLVDVPLPTPKADEVLVKIHATTVTAGDVIMRSLKLPPIAGWQKVFARLYLGVRKPRRPILGMEIAGTVAAVGEGITRFQIGQAVFASTASLRFGGYADYKCIPESGMILPKPATLSFSEAAALPGGSLTALRCLRKGDLQAGQHVLVYGASGAVGTSAVQIARALGARVTGVCSAANAALVKELGAASVIDYTHEDFTRLPARYDLIFDAVGKLTAEQVRRAKTLAPRLLNVLKDSGLGETVAELRAVVALVDAGHLRPFIDRTYALEHIVEAHRYVESGHKRGNVVITLVSP